MKYPKGIKIYINNNKIIANYANRGVSLEEDINISNAFYRDNNKAYIYKKPTPIKLVSVDYKFSKITFRTITESQRMIIFLWIFCILTESTIRLSKITVRLYNCSFY